MSFATQIAQDLSRVEFADWGESVTYTPSIGDPATITAIILRQLTQLDQTADGLEIRRHVPVVVMTAEVSTPARGDVLSFPVQPGGTAVDWNVTGVPLSRGGGTAQLECVRREPIEKTAQAHRKEI